jgi:hypothetical protein
MRSVIGILCLHSLFFTAAFAEPPTKRSQKPAATVQENPWVIPAKAEPVDNPALLFRLGQSDPALASGGFAFQYHLVMTLPNSLESATLEVSSKKKVKLYAASEQVDGEIFRTPGKETVTAKVLPEFFGKEISIDIGLEESDGSNRPASLEESASFFKVALKNPLYVHAENPHVNTAILEDMNDWILGLRIGPEAFDSMDRPAKSKQYFRYARTREGIASGPINEFSGAGSDSDFEINIRETIRRDKEWKVQESKSLIGKQFFGQIGLGRSAEASAIDWSPTFTLTVK